jgi:hypothetical protein
MSVVRYVVMSDLHLGAPYSLLTGTDPAGRAQPGGTSPVVANLVDGLAALLPRVAQDPPTLVLLGDVFELSFAPASHALETFRHLAHACFDRAVPLFAPTVLYVPGNHDHREWRVMRDALFLDEVTAAGGGAIGDPPAVTQPFDEPVACRVLTAALRGVLGNGYEVRSHYPNLGYANGERCVVMHHGHFLEGIYRLVSSAIAVLSGTRPSEAIDDIERINGPWIDVFWSSTGDQGATVSGDVYNLYEIMLDAGATHRATDEAAAGLLDVLGGRFGLHAQTEVHTHWGSLSVGNIVRGLLDVAIGKGAGGERASAGTVLSPSGVEGLRWYLSGPVAGQLGDRWTDPDVDLSFVFGHTHKPFQDELIVPGRARPLQVWNTGGWVVDRPGGSPVQGASAILVGDDARVASLRLFNDPVNDVMVPVHVAGTTWQRDHDNELLHHVRDALAEVHPAFDGFTAACRDGLRVRGTWLRRRLERRDPLRAVAGVRP